MSEVNPSTTSVAANLPWAESAREIAIAAGNYVRACLRRRQLEDDLSLIALSRAGHPGDPAAPIDNDLSDFIELAVRTMHPEVVFKSEEVERGSNLVSGKVFCRADPVDGTSNALALNTGWAVAIWFERVRGDRRTVSHLGGAIYCASGEVVSWAQAGGNGYVRVDQPAAPTYVGIPPHNAKNIWAHALLEEHADATTLLLERAPDGGHAPDLRSGNPRVIASVAASTDRRDALLDSFELSGYKLITLGGNPVIPALLLYDLGAVIEIEPIELRDALYTIPLKLMGGVVETFDGAPIDVIALFESLDQTVRIGPFIASTSPDIASAVRRRRRELTAA